VQRGQDVSGNDESPLHPTVDDGRFWWQMLAFFFKQTCDKQFFVIDMPQYFGKFRVCSSQTSSKLRSFGQNWNIQVAKVSGNSPRGDFIFGHVST